MSKSKNSLWASRVALGKGAGGWKAAVSSSGPVLQRLADPTPQILFPGRPTPPPKKLLRLRLFFLFGG